MGATYVALDLETTGLDLENDEIIEIGAVQFGADGVLDRFQALVNPGRPISPPVVELTGITDEAVRSAPPIWSVAPALEDFVGDSPIVGQNVLGFDIQFLRRAGVRHSENVYDTHLLAEMLLPGLADYGLAALCERFGIAQDVRHRALADAEAAQQLFIALRRRCAALAPEVLGQADQWLALTAWPSRGFFREISEEAVVRTPGTLSGRRQSTRPPEPLSPKGKPVAVAEEHVLSTLRLAGDHPEAFPAFDRRVVQETMTMAVARALNAEQRLMVEAGTGTGKSLAYLIPAACHAVANDDRVVVSTATINLQEQLLKKDIPGVQRLLDRPEQVTGNGEHGGSNGPSWRPEGAPLHSQAALSAVGTSTDSGKLRACQLKGRRNYLCLKRFDALRTAGVKSDEEAMLAARIVIWLAQTETGDRAELRLSQGEESVWRRLSADEADCTSSNSPYVVEGGCFLQKARRKAEASHIVVVNHALLLSDYGWPGAASIYAAGGGRSTPSRGRGDETVRLCVR